MKNLSQSIVKVVSLCLLISVSFFACNKNDTGVTPPIAAVPVITNVQPKNPSPGDVVTISGKGFGITATDVKITIGTQIITISSVSDIEIKFTLPVGITAGDIAVAIKNIIANNTDPQKATITPQIPAGSTITINPTSGKVGDLLSITGANFSLTLINNIVKFNGVTAIVTSSVGTVITVMIPTGATTGPVTVSINGGAIITGPTFTVNASAGGNATAVPYLIAVSGTATFSKLATATAEIGAMVVDKRNNVLYYSDYTVFATTHKGTVYKLKLDGSAPVELSTDARINTVFNIATDAAGNVFVEAGVDSQGIKDNIYKIDPSSGAVTVIANNVNFGGTGGVLSVDSQGAIYIGYSNKLNIATNSFDNISNLYSGFSPALYKGDDIYVGDVLKNNNVAFYKYNFLTKTGIETDFTLQGLFKQDNAAIGNSNIQSLDHQSRYALDNSENFYAIYPYGGDAASSSNEYYAVRKTKNGASGANTLISKFYTKLLSVGPPAVFYQQPRLNVGLLFQADATGNLYLKANGTDIIKIIP